MAGALATSLIEALLGLELGSPGQAGNRFLLEGVTLVAQDDGALEIGIQRLEAASLRLAAGPLVMDVGSIALQQVVAQLQRVDGRMRLRSLQAAGGDIAAVRIEGPLVLSRTPAAASYALHAQGGAAAAGDAATRPAAAAGCLGRLAAADGTIRAEIVDAHLLFDADVTVPIHRGEVDFNRATVEHVGPDSRMGVSRMGLYVDAPNGRSYLYQFPSAPLAGVEFERRGALLGPRVTDRGRLRLQPFGEGLLRQGVGGRGLGVTEQARLLLARTSLTGTVQLGDGRFAAPGVQAELVGRAEGRNAVRLHSEAVGRGLSLEMTSLSVRGAVLDGGNLAMSCDEIAGVLMLRLFSEDAQLRFALDLGKLKLSGLRVQPRRGGPAPEPREAAAGDGRA